MNDLIIISTPRSGVERPHRRLIHLGTSKGCRFSKPRFNLIIVFSIAVVCDGLTF